MLAVPVPARIADWGELVALSLTVKVVVRSPEPVGANFTLIVQLFPAESVVPQVVVREKSVEFEPVSEMVILRRLEVPAFERVIV